MNRYVTIQRGRKPAPPPEREEPNDIQVGNSKDQFSNIHPGTGLAERLAKLDRQRILKLRNRIKRSVETPIAHIVYPTSETSSDSLAFDKSSSQIVYSRPNSLNTRAPEESLPRTQGVHYIFPFSPQTKRESRQIDLNDQAEIVQENNESEITPSPNEEYKEDDVDDYEGWDYEVSVDKSVAEEFSVSKSIADMVDYITSTFAPPSTLLTTTTTETTTSQTTTSPTTTVKEKKCVFMFKLSSNDIE